jgi:nucleotide-binding universal stress UspA family protein
VSRIVVGIDTSPASKRALAWAVEDARRRAATLEVVHAFDDVGPLRYAGSAMVPLPSLTELESAAADGLEEILEVVDTADVPLVRTVRAGGAAQVLCRAAEGADLLVVGSRGLGGFRGLLLGSVSHQVAGHAPCPVVIVRSEDA